MKSNDNIPADEMLLAEATAAARASNLKWTSSALFRDESELPCKQIDATSCCATGALIVAGRATPLGDSPYIGKIKLLEFSQVATGNDLRAERGWRFDGDDLGESLGWAFRCFARSALDTAIGHDQHWLPSAYQLRAWEKQRLVRAEGNRRMG